MNTQDKIKRIGDNITKILLEKNKRYGDSALQPLGIFGKFINNEDTACAGILVRLDDKLSRIRNSNELRKNDVFDLIGYLTLLSAGKEWNFDDQID